MPELPEVQTVVNDLIDAQLVGATITGAKVYWPKTIAEHTPGAFGRLIKGRSIRAIRRRAKFIVFDLDQGRQLLIHLRMTGRLELVPPREARNKHQHVRLSLDREQELRFFDPRKFGRLYLVDEGHNLLGRLGPEPLAPGFTAHRLGERLQAKQRLLKPLLLDQTFVAGLGNIYVDEALWDAGIHPTRRSNSLTKAETKALHRSIRKVLRRGLKNLGTTLGTGQTTFYSVARNRGRNRDALKVFRRSGLPCPRCRSPIVRMTVGQRSTHVCPACQKE
jgi:formamidopyrimidine-DNA glycosylase